MSPVSGAAARAVSPVARPATLVERLRADVVNHAGVATLSCVFEPGGKLHGVGIASDLYCRRCGQSRIWHDVAEAAAIVAACEAAAKLPF